MRPSLLTPAAFPSPLRNNVEPAPSDQLVTVVDPIWNWPPLLTVTLPAEVRPSSGRRTAPSLTTIWPVNAVPTVVSCRLPPPPSVIVWLPVMPPLKVMAVLLAASKAEVTSSGELSWIAAETVTLLVPSLTAPVANWLINVASPVLVAKVRMSLAELLIVTLAAPESGWLMTIEPTVTGRFTLVEMPVLPTFQIATASVAFGGPPAGLQFPAFFQLLFVLPVQVKVWAFAEEATVEAASAAANKPRRTNVERDDDLGCGGG